MLKRSRKRSLGAVRCVDSLMGKMEGGLFSRCIISIVTDKENLIALCFSCHIKVDREAALHFEHVNKQLSLFPELDYLSAMKDLWWRGVQTNIFDVMEKPVLSVERSESRKSVSGEQLEFLALNIESK